jgi:hypothetical protein
MTNISQYDKRKANIKVKLLNLTLIHLSDKKFDEINIKDICVEAEVSRVTYFKYFPNKGDILLYFMTIWSYKLEVEITEKSLTGLKAIECAFQNVSEIKNHMNVMMGLIGFIAKMKEKPNDHQLSFTEKQIVLPGIDERNYKIEGLKLNQFFELHLKEARSNKELDAGINIDETVLKLFSVFYGTPLSLFILNNDELEKN